MSGEYAGGCQLVVPPSTGDTSAPGIVAINSGHVPMHHSSASIAQLDGIKREIHAGPAFDLSGLLYRADVPVESCFVKTAGIDHSCGEAIANA